jgi:hypothetical protein
MFSIAQWVPQPPIGRSLDGSSPITYVHNFWLWRPGPGDSGYRQYRYGDPCLLELEAYVGFVGHAQIPMHLEAFPGDKAESVVAMRFGCIDRFVHVVHSGVDASEGGSYK